jgi:hypothetical protein
MSRLMRFGGKCSNVGCRLKELPVAGFESPSLQLHSVYEGVGNDA